jgi:hypothetical protein
VANEGVEIDLAKVQMIERGLDELYHEPYCLLVNRLNSYSHTHDSMEALASFTRLAGLAILVYSDSSRKSAEVHRLYQGNVGVFHTEREALAWLRGKLKESG